MTDIDPLMADFATRFPDSFARVLSRASANDVSRALGQLPPRIKASIVARLPGAQVTQLLNSGKHTPELWLADASFDDAVMLLSRLPRERRLAMVNSLRDSKRRQRLLRHQQYPAHSVGALVGDILLRIRLDASAKDVAHELREIGGDDPVTIVVVDSDGCYAGLLNLWRLLARDRPVGKVRDYVRTVAPISPETPIPSAVRNEGWFDHDWLPVVDQKQRVLGAVSRARLYRAARAFSVQEQGATDAFLEIVSGSVYALGALLESVLSRRSEP